MPTNKSDQKTDEAKRQEGAKHRPQAESESDPEGILSNKDRDQERRAEYAAGDRSTTLGAQQENAPPPPVDPNRPARKPGLTITGNNDIPPGETWGERQSRESIEAERAAGKRNQQADDDKTEASD